jgi:hypothetical protein
VVVAISSYHIETLLIFIKYLIYLLFFISVIQYIFPWFSVIGLPALKIYNGARNLSWCRQLIASCGACLGVAALQSCHGSSSKSKNRDNFPLHGTTCPVQREVVPQSGKQMTFIVRVSCYFFLFQRDNFHRYN